MNIRNKLVVSFLSLAVFVLLAIGLASVHVMGLMSRAAEQSAARLGEIAASDSAATLIAMGEANIRQKAEDVAAQVRIFIDSHPRMTQSDVDALAAIAVQPVGRTGYTLMYDRDAAAMVFHVNPALIGFDLRTWAERLPDFWRIFEQGMAGRPASGYYEWEEPDGSKRNKYMYVAPVAGTGYAVAATTYIDEFLQPVKAQQERITGAAMATAAYIEEQRKMMQMYLIALTVAILALVGLSSFYLARSLSRPITILTEGARLLAGGKLGHRVEVKTGDELEALAGQFNTMAAALEQSQATLEEKVAERTRAERRRAEQIRAVSRAGRRISSLMDPDELLPFVVNLFHETFGYYYVGIYLVDRATGDLMLRAAAGGETGAGSTALPQKIASGLPYWVAREGLPALVNDVDRDNRYTVLPGASRTGAELAAPVRMAGDILGVLDIHSTEKNAFDDLDLSTAGALADYVAIAIENARLYRDIKEMAVLQERNRLAREIHDTLAQGFVGVVLQLEAAEQAMERDPAQASRHIIQAKTLARESLNEARRSVLALRPQSREQLSLTEAMRQEVTRFTRTTGIKASFGISGEVRTLPPDIEDPLLRICQEALTNVRRHANASSVVVTLRYNDDRVILTVQDNGVGFDPRAPLEGRFGLLGMRERARLIGGTLEVDSEPARGTVIRVSVPAAF